METSKGTNRLVQRSLVLQSQFTIMCLQGHAADKDATLRLLRPTAKDGKTHVLLRRSRSGRRNIRMASCSTVAPVTIHWRMSAKGVCDGPT